MEPKRSKARSSSKAFYWLGIGSTVVAIGLHAYLASLHFQMKYGTGDGDSICNLNATFNCAAVAASRFSEFWFAPLALWGAVTNFTLLALALLFPLTDNANQGSARRSILAFSGFIAAASVIMGGISLTAMSAYCLFCILTYILSFTTFAGFYWGLDDDSSGRAARGKLSQPAQSFVNIKALAICGLVVLAGTYLINHGAKKNYTAQAEAVGSDFNKQIQAFVNEWLHNPQQTIEPIAPLVKGSNDANAKMTIVEFADFRCSHCKHAAPVLDGFVKAHPDVRLIFQAWPLDGECNSAISASNGASCALARAVHCSAKTSQEKGWEAHGWIFEHQSDFMTLDAVNTRLPDMAKAIGVDWKQVKTCMDSDEARKAIEGQAQAGTRLSIQGTPAIFVNGRQLPAGQALPVLQSTYQAIMSGAAEQKKE